MTQNIPYSQFSPNAIVLYEEYMHHRGKTSENPFKTINEKGRKYNSQMSKSTREQLRKRLSVYYDCMYTIGQDFRKQNKIFHPILTLTLPARQNHTDNEIKRSCLTRFVERIRYNYDVRFYYWVAEKQKNGNIHFHVLLDRFIPHNEVREIWNTRLETLNYISDFESKHGHRNPNSTDIQAIRNLAKSSDYVTKYTSKCDQSGGIEGRLHGECDLLKQCARYKEVVWSEMFDKLEALAKRKVLEKKQLDKCWVYTGDIRRMMQKHMPYTLKSWDEYNRSIAELFYN